MKKKVRATRRSTANRSTRRTGKRASEHLLLLPFSFRRVVLITTALTLFLGVFVYFNKNDVTQSVAGVSIAKGLFAQATVEVPHADGAVSYNIYYKKRSSNDFNNAVRGVPPETTSYTISYLKKGEEYHYRISAVDGAGKEFWFSEMKDLENIVPMD